MRNVIVGVLLAGCHGGGNGAPAPPAAPTPVTFTIRNAGTSGIVVESAERCGQEPVVVSDASGVPIRWLAQVQECDDVRAGRCVTFGGCPGPQPIPLAAGETLDVAWPGVSLVSREIAAPPKDCPSSCVDRVAVRPGTYTARARAWSHCDGACTGEPDLVVEASVTLPSTGPVELRFQAPAADAR